MSLAILEPVILSTHDEHYSDPDIFIRFGIDILERKGYADFTDYYQKLNAIENDLTVILYDINDALNSNDDRILIEKLTELTYLKEDMSTYICKFKMNADDIDSYFNDIKLERITPSPDSVVCDLKEEWFIRMKKLEQIYEKEKMQHYIKVDKSIAPSSGWSLTSSIANLFKLTSSSKSRTHFKSLEDNQEYNGNPYIDNPHFDNPYYNELSHHISNANLSEYHILNKC
jgi:hypothetical protein